MEEKITQNSNEEIATEETVEAPFVVDEPAFAEDIEETVEEENIEDIAKEVPEESLDADGEVPAEDTEAEEADETTQTAEDQDADEEFNINILISNNGPIDSRVAKRISQKVLRDNVGYKGRFVAKFVDGYTAKSTGDNIVILNRIQISFGRQFSLTLPITIRVDGNKFEDLDHLTHADLVSFDGEIAESDQINEGSGKPYMTIADIHNVEIVSRGFAYQREQTSNEE